MTSTHFDPNIIADIQRVATHLGTSILSRSEYVQHGRFSLYQIYDGGTTWEGYCQAANLQSKRKEEVPDEVYFGRLVRAIQELGRHPKASERKRFGLNFSKRRFPTLPAFIQAAVEQGIVAAPKSQDSHQESAPQASHIEQASTSALASASTQPTPPIPAHTSRTRWERIDISGFPYAPQDESGTVALFGILCSQRIIQWDIVDLNAGKGIDCTCWDHVMKRELRVEIKHTLTRAGWNHVLDDVDYVVCWENRWPDFQKPVVVLRTLIESLKR